MSAKESLADAVTGSTGWRMGQALGHDIMADPDDRVMVSQQTQTLIMVVTIGLVAVIGILVYGNVLDAIGDPSTTAAENRTELENSTVGVTEGFGDAMDLMPVVLLVMIASLVIAVVQRF